MRCFLNAWGQELRGYTHTHTHTHTHTAKKALPVLSLRGFGCIDEGYTVMERTHEALRARDSERHNK